MQSARRSNLQETGRRGRNPSHSPFAKGGTLKGLPRRCAPRNDKRGKVPAIHRHYCHCEPLAAGGGVVISTVPHTNPLVLVHLGPPLRKPACPANGRCSRPPFEKGGMRGIFVIVIGAPPVVTKSAPVCHPERSEGSRGPVGHSAPLHCARFLSRIVGARV